MKNVRMKFIVVFLLCISYPLWDCAETIARQQKPKRKTKVETSYDEIKKETTARIGPYEIWKPPHNSVAGESNFEAVGLTVSFSYPGRKIVTPKQVTIMVFSTSQRSAGFEAQATGEFEKRRAFSVSTDSKQYNFGEAELVGIGKGRVATRVFEPANAVLVREVVKKVIPLEDFSQIAQSEKAEIKVGDRKFKLKKDHLEAFRNFVSLMEQDGMEF